MSKGIAACKDIVATTGNENLVVRRLDLSWEVINRPLSHLNSRFSVAICRIC